MMNNINLKRTFCLSIMMVTIISCIGCGKKDNITSANDTKTDIQSTQEEVSIIPDTENTLKDNIYVDDSEPWMETLMYGWFGNIIDFKFDDDVKIIIRTWSHGTIVEVNGYFTHSSSYYDTEHTELVIPSYKEHLPSPESEAFRVTWIPEDTIRNDYRENDYKGEPYMAVTIFEEENIVGAALIGVEEREDKDGKVEEYVVLKNSVTFPKQNGEYQKVSGEYLNEYFDINFDGFGDVKKEDATKVKIPEQNINVGNNVDYAAYDESSDMNSIHFSYNEKTKMSIEVDGGKAYINELKFGELIHEKHECASGETMDFDFKEGEWVDFSANNPEEVISMCGCKNKSLDKRCETVYWDGFYDYIDEKGNLKEGVELSDKKHYMKVVIKEEDNIIGAALIKMEYKLIDEQWTASIHTEKSIEYPKENGEYQNITQEMVEEYFEAK